MSTSTATRRRRIVPEEWRVVRWLLRLIVSLGFVNSALALEWERPFLDFEPFWLAFGLHSAAPIAVGVAAIFLIRRLTEARFWRRLIVATVAMMSLQVAGEVWLVVWIRSSFRDIWPDTCSPSPPDCGKLLARAFDGPSPPLPPRAAGGLEFSHGEETSPNRFLFVYDSQRAEDPVHVLISRAGGQRTPAGDVVVTPLGRRVQEVTDHELVGRLVLDVGDDRYLVDLGGVSRASPRYRSGIALADALG